MYLVFGLLLLILFLVFAWFVVSYKYFTYLRELKGPFWLPLLGHAYLITATKELLPLGLKYMKKFKGSYKVLFCHKPRLIITEPKDAEELLGSSIILEKSYEYKFFHSWLGTGLLTSSALKWKRQRKLLTPTFHFQILEQFIEIFDNQSDILVEKLETKCNGEEFDIFPFITLCALDIICGNYILLDHNIIKLQWVHKFMLKKYSDSEYVKSVQHMCNIILNRTVSPLKISDFLYKFSKDYQIEKKALNVLHGYTNSVIKKRRELLLIKSRQNYEQTDEIGRKKRLAFLDLLLQCNIDGEPLSDEVIREEVDTFMFEGHDTTTSGMSFTLYCLSKNKDVQDKVIDELRTIFGENKYRSSTYSDLQEMKYLEMVIKETMRLYPPVPIYSRILEEDIMFGKTLFPKGLTLTVFVYGLHRHSDVYPNPETFDPERFSAKNTLNRPPYAYVPFSAGPRNCIGQRFAMLEMKSTISKVLRQFELLPVHEHTPQLTPDVILKSSNGLNIRIEKRQF